MSANEPLKPDPDPAQLVDASRRTYLAGERTQLAWWRTGLTALAVALGIGRVVPELGGTATRWPYVVAGVGFALWGIFALAYGTPTARRWRRRCGRDGSTMRLLGRSAPSPPSALPSGC